MSPIKAVALLSLFTIQIINHVEVTKDWNLQYDQAQINRTNVVFNDSLHLANEPPHSAETCQRNAKSSRNRDHIRATENRIWTNPLDTDQQIRPQPGYNTIKNDGVKPSEIPPSIRDTLLQTDDNGNDYFPPFDPGEEIRHLLEEDEPKVFQAERARPSPNALCITEVTSAVSSHTKSEIEKKVANNIEIRDNSW